MNSKLLLQAFEKLSSGKCFGNLIDLSKTFKNCIVYFERGNSTNSVIKVVKRNDGNIFKSLYSTDSNGNIMRLNKPIKGKIVDYGGNVYWHTGGGIKTPIWNHPF